MALSGQSTKKAWEIFRQINRDIQGEINFSGTSSKVYKKKEDFPADMIINISGNHKDGYENTFVIIREPTKEQRQLWELTKSKVPNSSFIDEIKFDRDPAIRIGYF